MKIGVDLDGVVFDFAGAFLNYCNIKYGTNNHPADCTEWNFQDCANIHLTEQMVLESFDDFNKYRMWQSMDVFPDVKESLCALEAMGNKIIYITHRMEGSERPTLKAIIKHGLPIHGIFFCETSKEKADICRKMDIPLAIDDKYDTIKEYEEAGIIGVLMGAPYNERIEHKYKVDDMSGLVKIIRNYCS